MLPSYEEAVSTMTAQEFFDDTARKLFAQGRKSLKANGDCAYRGENGLRCAAGFHIKDDEYRPEMDDSKLLHELYSDKMAIDEGTALHSLKKVGLLPPILREHFKLARRLQEAHDSSAVVDRNGRFVEESLRVELRSAALDFDLDDAVLDTLTLGG